MAHLGHRAFPSIARLGKRVATDEGGKLAFDLDLNTLSRPFGMNRHTVDERAEALHQRALIVNRFGVMG
ncbi:hypothetical protein [Mesorhizobium sp. M0701]|uniref:hypothetical protein n=1 Tax=Mesorhizobium sp. M0701 TaxID=2956989 RepID=UPI003337C349